jgi:large subunit ribosomal protein L7/L12
MSIKTVEILEQLKSLSLVETSELIKRIESTFNIDASPAPVIKYPVLLDINTTTENTQTEFDVVVEAIPSDKKIAVLKVVRTVTVWGLKEAKDAVDSTPFTVTSGINYSDAQDMQKALEEAGARVLIK